MFYVTISGNFERVQWLNSKTDFVENKNLFQKLENCFLVESTKIKNVSFQYKTATPEANVKTNRMVSTKWTITKNRVLPVTTLYFLKLCFCLRTSYKRLMSCTTNPNAHIRTFCKHWSII